MISFNEIRANSTRFALPTSLYFEYNNPPTKKDAVNKIPNTPIKNIIRFLSRIPFLVSKIPELRQVVNDVFEDVEADILSQHIKKLVSLLEKQSMGNFNTWTMPEQPESVRKSFNDLIL